MRAIEFIFESYPLAKKEFSQVADPAVVQTTIDQYRELVKRNQFRNPEEKNINYWRERGWEAFSQMVKLKSSDISDTQRKRGKVVGNSILLRDDAEWTVVIPLDKESSVYYGRGTEWCTTKPFHSYFEDYVYNRNITLIYAIDNATGIRSVAISIEPDNGNGEKIEMFNKLDNPISARRYTEISGLDSAEFINMSKSPETRQQLKQIAASREKYNLSIKTTQKLLGETPLDPEAIERELKFTKHSSNCYNYIIKYSQEQNRKIAFHPIILTAAANNIRDNQTQQAVELGRCIDFSTIPLSTVKSILRLNPNLFTYNFELLSREQRNLFVTSAAAAYQYATVILNGTRFPEGEPAIATSAKYAYYYAEAFANQLPDNRFAAGEAAIANDTEYAYMYALMVIREPFPAGEAAIANDTEYAYNYAKRFFKQLPDNRFAAGEPAIAKDEWYSTEYAIKILKKPFPVGEAAINASVEYSIKYIEQVLAYHRSPTWENLIKDDIELAYLYASTRGEPFPAGEAIIATNARYSYLYAKHARKGPFPAGEPAIFASSDYLREYVQEVLANHRSPTWEKLIKSNPVESLMYAEARKERFPAGEKAIATDAECAFYYAKNALNERFPAGENAIATNPELAHDYDIMFDTNLSQR